MKRTALVMLLLVSQASAYGEPVVVPCEVHQGWFHAEYTPFDEVNNGETDVITDFISERDLLGDMVKYLLPPVQGEDFRAVDNVAERKVGSSI